MQDVTFCSDPYDCAAGADGAGDRHRMGPVPRARFRAPGRGDGGAQSIDLRNVYRAADARRRGFRYVGVGLPDEDVEA